MKTVRYIYMLLLPLMMAGCGKDGFDAGVGTGQNGEIAFEIGFADKTRVATGADFASVWEDDDAIGIFAVAHDAGLSSTAAGNYIHNVKLTYNGSAWIPDAPQYWPQSGKLDFYAYYPYDASLTDPTAIAFSVSADQSASGAFGASDLLASRSDNSGDGWAKGSTVALTFTHSLALVQVDITDRGDFVPEYDAEHLKVTMHGLQTSATLDLSGGTAAAGGNAGSVVMMRVDTGNADEWIYRAVVPSQTIAAGAVLFSFEQDVDGDEDLEGDFTDFRFVYSASEARTLAAGEYTEFDIKADWGDSGDYTPAAWAFIRWAQLTDGWQTSDFTLTGDIDLTGFDWKPVGDGSTQFTRTFDGGGYTITGLSVDTDAIHAGLFGFVGSGGEVRNVTVSGTVAGTAHASGIAGYNYGTITDCTFNGTVMSSGTVISTDSHSYAGGIAGVNGFGATITGCSFNGTVMSTGIYSYAGGIVCDNVGTITGCSVGENSTITGTGSGSNIYTASSVGGIAGHNNGPITGCSVGKNCTVTAAGKYVGGIAGRNILTGSSIAGSWSAAKSVTGAEYVGGIVGDNAYGSIQYCHWLWNDPTGFGGNAVADGSATNCEKFATVAELNALIPDMNTAISSSGWQWVAGSTATDWPTIVKQ